MPSVDASRARSDEIPVKPVDVTELHRRLAAEAKSLGLATIECQHRLYVDGRSLVAAAELRDTPQGWPHTHVEDADVLFRVAHPHKYQRGYLCLKAAKPDGDVVITLFVRAMLERELLQIEVSVHALPEVTWPRDEKPVARLLTETKQRTAVPLDVIVPRRRTRAVAKGIWMGTKQYWPTLFGCFRRCAAAATSPVAQHVSRWNDRRRIAGQDFDFGPRISLREDLAWNQQMHYNALVDMVTQVQRLQHRLIRAVTAYLEYCGIDPGDFAAASITIITNLQQNIFKDLKAGAMTFGSNSPATGSVTTPPAPSPPPSQGNQGRP